MKYLNFDHALNLKKKEITDLQLKIDELFRQKFKLQRDLEVFKNYGTEKTFESFEEK